MKKGSEKTHDYSLYRGREEPLWGRLTDQREAKVSPVHHPAPVPKRQRTGAVQDLPALPPPPIVAKRRGLRYSSTAFRSAKGWTLSQRLALQASWDRPNPGSGTTSRSSRPLHFSQTTSSTNRRHRAARPGGGVEKKGGAMIL